ncbi:hypothetical protein BH23CHL2_BH23CHL2_05790 [soil metagenome]
MTNETTSNIRRVVGWLLEGIKFVAAGIGILVFAMIGLFAPGIGLFEIRDSEDLRPDVEANARKALLTDDDLNDVFRAGPDGWVIDAEPIGEIAVGSCSAEPIEAQVGFIGVVHRNLVGSEFGPVVAHRIYVFEHRSKAEAAMEYARSAYLCETDRIEDVPVKYLDLEIQPVGDDTFARGWQGQDGFLGAHYVLVRRSYAVVQIFVLAPEYPNPDRTFHYAQRAVEKLEKSDPELSD